MDKLELLVSIEQLQDQTKELQEENKHLKMFLGEYDIQVDYYQSELAGSWHHLRHKVVRYLKEKQNG